MALHRHLWSAFVAAVLFCTASNTVLANYIYDQAGNRKQLTYPGGEVLGYTPTVLNQVDAVSLNAAPLVNYDYQGRLLDKRRTTTTAPGGTTIYEYDVGYDSHRRVNEIVNRFQPGGGNLQTLAAYGFSHDANGNPLTQTVAEGLSGFVADDRAFTVDRLNRLTGTDYFENGQVESTTFDRVGNRESHTDRAGTVTGYGPINTANEYASIGGTAVTYDAAGNLSVDQTGRQYTYDELNRLKQVRGPVPTSTVLATYTYDALGRRITFNDPVAGFTTRYYYDGQSVIEERNASDVRVRYHVNGNQFIDEHVATFTVATGQFTYYLSNANYSIAGTGNADGSVIERLNYSATGDFAGGGAGASAFYHDADNDLDIDLHDFATFQNCFGLTTAPCLTIHDFDTSDAQDGDVDLADFTRWSQCGNGPFVTPDQACGMPMRSGPPAPSGTFGMHGRAFDVLSDGSVSQDFRARTYLPQLGRWLQRDPTGYADGVDLYEAFRGNSVTHVDPLGTEVWAEGRRVKTTLNGVPVWRVDYVLSRDGVSLGIGGIFWRSAVESEHAGTEYFRYTEDLRELRRIDSLIENQRQIVQDLQIANIQIASLEQGIKTSATIAVALPLAAVAAPVASAAFSTTTAAGITTTTIGGNIAATALTGGVSLGVGSATGEALIGGTAGEIVQAGGEGLVVGALVSAPFGLLAPVGATTVARTAAPTQLSVTGDTPSRLLSTEVSQTFQGRIREITLQREATAIRIFGGGSTQLGRSEGVFLTTRRFGQLGASQLRETLALPPGNLANQITTVQVPAGTRLFIGRIGPQRFPEVGQVFPGGGTQVFVPDKSGLIFAPPRAFP